jgi:hypothetical protein
MSEHSKMRRNSCTILDYFRIKGPQQRSNRYA